MTPDQLIDAWRGLGEVPTHSGGMQRVRLDTESAADVFACIYWPNGRPGLLIEGNGAYRAVENRIPTCRGVRTIHEVIGAPVERTVLRVMLEDDRLLDIFAVLSADLINVAISESTVSAAMRKCLERISLWQGLLERVPAEGLSDERQRGMMGELLILESLLMHRLSAFAAVSAWVGPDSAHQDFIHGGTAIEVKTSLAKRHARIIIANEKQLDESPHNVLVLAHVRLDESATLGESLPIVVNRLRRQLNEDPAAARLFDDKLMLGGFIDVQAPIYVLNRWRLSSSRFFRVNGDFPRLTEANLPLGVGDIHYSIIAEDLGRFEITADEAAFFIEVDDV